MCCAPDYFFFFTLSFLSRNCSRSFFSRGCANGLINSRKSIVRQGGKDAGFRIIRVGCIVDDPGAMRRVNRARVRCECAPFKGGTRSIILEDCVHIFLNSNGNERICILGHPDGIPDFCEACVVETHLPMRAFHVRGTQHSLYFVIMKALLFIYRPGR